MEMASPENQQCPGKSQFMTTPLLPPEMLYVASFQEACCCCSDYSSQIISYQTITADLL